MCFCCKKKHPFLGARSPGCHLSTFHIQKAAATPDGLGTGRRHPEKTPKKTPRKGRFNRGEKKNGKFLKFLCFFVCFLSVWNCESSETDDDFLGYYMVWAETSVQWVLPEKMKGNWSTDLFSFSQTNAFNLCSTASHSHQKPSRSPTLEIDLILQKVQKKVFVHKEEKLVRDDYFHCDFNHMNQTSESVWFIKKKKRLVVINFTYNNMRFQSYES